MRYLLILYVLSLLAAACTPVVMPAGPAVSQPAVTGDHLVMADGAELALRSWPADGKLDAVILARHGFNDYSNAFALPAEILTSQSIMVYAYGQRGFGASEIAGYWPGTETLVQDARTATALLSQRHPDTPLYLMGNSIGSAVAAVAVLRDASEELSGLILVAPAV